MNAYKDFRGSDSEGFTSTKDLYPSYKDINPFLASAMKLLDEGIDYLSEAVISLQENDTISSDDYVQKFQALLPELFCCRELGDGFAAIICAVYQAIYSNDINPLSKIQLNKIRLIIKRVQSEPFIDFDEEVGLEVSPPHLNIVSEMLNERSDS